MVYDINGGRIDEGSGSISVPASFYETVSALKNAGDLSAGSVVQTAGFYASNDGGGARYWVRAKKSSDTDNGCSLFVIGSLVAEILDTGKEINVLQYGMKPDGTTNNLPVFNKVKALYPDRTLYFPAGVYAMAGKVVFELCHAVLDNAELLCISSTVVDRFVEVRGKVTPPETPQDGMFLRGPGGTINANFKAKTAFACARQKGFTLTGLTIKNFTESGVSGNFDDSTLGENLSYELYVSNCLISNVLSEADAVGIIDWSDSTYTDIVILNCKTAVSASGSSVFHNIHAWCYDFDNSANRLELMTDTLFALCRAGARFSDCYCDTYAKGFEFISGHTMAMISNFKWFINTGTWPSGLTPVVFMSCPNVSGTNYKVVNAYIPNTAGTKFSDVDISNSLSTFVGVVSYAEGSPSAKLSAEGGNPVAVSVQMLDASSAPAVEDARFSLEREAIFNGQDQHVLRAEIGALAQDFSITFSADGSPCGAPKTLFACKAAGAAPVLELATYDADSSGRLVLRQSIGGKTYLTDVDAASPYAIRYVLTYCAETHKFAVCIQNGGELSRWSVEYNPTAEDAVLFLGGIRGMAQNWVGTLYDFTVHGHALSPEERDAYLKEENDDRTEPDTDR